LASSLVALQAAKDAKITSTTNRESGDDPGLDFLVISEPPLARPRAFIAAKTRLRRR
jgi:hypothetical protein